MYSAEYVLHRGISLDATIIFCLHRTHTIIVLAESTLRTGYGYSHIHPVPVHLKIVNDLHLKDSHERKNYKSYYR